MRHTVSFAATRSVTVSDLNTLVARLLARGYNVEPFYEEVRWRVRWAGCGRKDVRLSHSAVLDFTPAAIVFKHVPPVWCAANEIELCADGEFTDAELLAIRADTVCAFDAIDNTIKNDNRGIHATDTPELVRIYRHYDYKEALERWTVPSHAVRLFRCWKCLRWLPCCDYKASFEDLLARYALQASLSCCSMCQDKMCRVKWSRRVVRQLRARVD